MVRPFLIATAVVIALFYTVIEYSEYEEGVIMDGNWYLLNLHQHVWDGREWGRDRVNYTTVIDLMFNGSYFNFDGVLINDQLPTENEITEFREYVSRKYPNKLYLVGGHYHIRWHDQEISISLMIPSANATMLPKEFYECEEITNLTLEEIAAEVHRVNGLLIWDHPFFALDTLTKEEVDTLMGLFDGIELVTLRGKRGAGSLTREELEEYWNKVRPYVYEGKIFPVAVTDYSGYLGMPERRGAFWLNRDYGTFVKAATLEEEAILQALREKKAVAILRTKDGELLAFGVPNLIKEARKQLQFNGGR